MNFSFHYNAETHIKVSFFKQVKSIFHVNGFTCFFSLCYAVAGLGIERFYFYLEISMGFLFEFYALKSLNGKIGEGINIEVFTISAY